MHTLTYPIYNDFNRRCYRKYNTSVKRGDFDVIHAMTPIIPRFPYKIIRSCSDTPFLLGPVNGGIPFPEAFKKTGRKEFSQFNFLRVLTNFLPDYNRTFQGAAVVLSGSEYTRDFILQKFNRSTGSTLLFHENGIESDSIGKMRELSGDRIDLLFVGRLVPYKGADMAIEIVRKIKSEYSVPVHLTIVGDGPERTKLEGIVSDEGLGENVSFTGWIEHNDIHGIYLSSDVFLFPSIREFGGAVVLEAMARGLPCIVPDYGGVGEYVTDQCGFRYYPDSRESLVNNMASAVVQLYGDKELYKRKSQAAIERTKEYIWTVKGRRISGIYEQLASNMGKR